jgi:anti-sigma factor RsiW
VTSNDGTASPVDLDLLADYLDDVLPAGPAAMVAHRIESDPRWASAAERLREVTPAVTDMLRITDTEPMPDAMFDRFLAALPDRTPVPASAGELSGADSVGADSRTRDCQDASPARVISLDDRRRRSLWSGLAKVAAALIVLAGIGTGIGVGIHATSSATKSSSGVASNAEGAPLRAGAGGVVPEITVSGRDYGSDLRFAPGPSRPYAQSPARPTPGRAQGSGTDSASVVPGALQRLANGGLPGCLAQVRGQFGAVPVKADFAYYAGTPAVVVTLSNATVVAVGAECGLPGAGANVLATGH